MVREPRGASLVQSGRLSAAALSRKPRRPALREPADMPVFTWPERGEADPAEDGSDPPALRPVGPSAASPTRSVRIAEEANAVRSIPPTGNNLPTPPIGRRTVAPQQPARPADSLTVAELLEEIEELRQALGPSAAHVPAVSSPTWKARGRSPTPTERAAAVSVPEGIPPVEATHGRSEAGAGSNSKTQHAQQETNRVVRAPTPAQTREEAAELSSPRPYTCDYDCGFCGSFDVVERHELTCSCRPTSEQSAEQHASSPAAASTSAPSEATVVLPLPAPAPSAMESDEERAQREADIRAAVTQAAISAGLAAINTVPVAPSAGAEPSLRAQQDEPGAPVATLTLEPEVSEQALPPHEIAAGQGQEAKTEKKKEKKKKTEEKKKPQEAYAEKFQRMEELIAYAWYAAGREDEARAHASSAASSAAEVSVVFTEHGSLGLNLAPCDSYTGAEVLDVKAGTQATHHKQLRAGLIVRAVGGTSVLGMSHEEVTSVIIGHSERPLLVQFAASSSAMVSEERIATLESEKAALEARVEELSSGMLMAPAEE